MHLLKSVFAASALIAVVVAQSKIQFTEWPSSLQAGQPATVKWTGGDAGTPVTITLRKGPAANLNNVKVLTTDGTGGSFTFTPETSLPNGPDYAFEISQGGSVNYSGQIKLTDGSNAPAASASAQATMASATITTDSANGASMTGSAGSMSAIKHASTTMGTGVVASSMATGPASSYTMAGSSSASGPASTSGSVATPLTPSSGIFHSSSSAKASATSKANAGSVSSVSSSSQWLLGAIAFVAYYF